MCIRDASEAFSVKPRFPDQFLYLTLDVKDTEDQNLITLFPGFVHFPAFRRVMSDFLSLGHVILFTMRSTKVVEYLYIAMVESVFPPRL